MRLLLFALASVALAIVVAFVGDLDELAPFLRALMANLAVIAWTSFVVPIRGLPRMDGYYRLRAWERSGHIYVWLGVPFFRAAIRRGPLSIFNRRLPAAWKQGDPDKIVFETMTAEGGHLIAFLIVLAMAIGAWSRGDWEMAGWLAIIDLPMNLYPVLLQRDHRQRLLEKVQKGELESDAEQRKIARGA
jgi:hypothetical protein